MTDRLKSRQLTPVPRRYGALPGIPDDTLFLTRAALHDSGVHRHIRAGISLGATGAAESVLLSGGYEDDEEQGDLILYTGQGGSDPKTGKQTADQTLTTGNRALLKNIGEMIPVRVVRGANHASPLSPPVGYVYAGLYRVEAGWEEPGRSGFSVWRFRLLKINLVPATNAVPP